jgi:tryptophan synthase alpha subunit
MLAAEHIRTVRKFLEKADLEFVAGESLQAFEKLWGAASHTVIAVAQQRGWERNNHGALRSAVRRLAREYNDPSLVDGFGVAEKFHANFYHGFMADDELDFSRPSVQRFVERVLAI